MSSKKSIPWLYYLVNGIFILVAFIIFFNFIPKSWFQKKEDIFHSERERIELKFYVSGFLAKEEILITAPVDGKVKRLALAGELQAKSTDIVEITTANGTVTKVQNEQEGFITYIKDNCETTHTLTAFNDKKLLLSEVLTPPVKKERVGEDQSVKKGDFLFKILKNTLIRYSFVAESDPSSYIVKGQDYVFASSKPTSIMINGTVESITPIEDGKYYIVFSSSYYIDTMINERVIEGNFYFGFIDGFRIPQSAMGMEENEKKEKKYFILIKSDDASVEKKYVQVKTFLPVTKEYIITGYIGSDTPFSENESVYKHQEKAVHQLSPSGK